MITMGAIANTYGDQWPEMSCPTCGAKFEWYRDLREHLADTSLKTACSLETFRRETVGFMSQTMREVNRLKEAGNDQNLRTIRADFIIKHMELCKRWNGVADVWVSAKLANAILRGNLTATIHQLAITDSKAADLLIKLTQCQMEELDIPKMSNY